MRRLFGLCFVLLLLPGTLGAAEAALRETRAERDGWRICAVATGVAGVLAVVVVMLVK